MSGLLTFISLSVWTGMSQSIVAIWFSVTVAGSCYYHYHYHHYYSGAPYSYGKQKQTHELIFSWLSWLAVLLVGVYARRRRRRWSRAT